MAEPLRSAPAATCGSCGTPATVRRLLAFPVEGRKRWLCPACLNRALEGAALRPGAATGQPNPVESVAP